MGEDGQDIRNILEYECIIHILQVSIDGGRKSELWHSIFIAVWSMMTRHMGKRYNNLQALIAFTACIIALILNFSMVDDFTLLIGMELTDLPQLVLGHR